MSREAEERAERWFALNRVDCARNFTIGAKVYRAHYNKIQEGEVVRVSRCKLVSNGDPQECVDGDHPYYVARFGGTNAFNGDYENQTWEWKFFSRPEFARHRLVEQIESQVLDHQRDIERLRKLADEVKAQGALDCEDFMGFPGR